ncbi:MAG TPA: hypothetical protein VLG12_00640 [Candidatus Saccharimonadales bacterium]|nr:hypothetical protein [Candidatus Saccharimonadales bacterium]
MKPIIPFSDFDKVDLRVGKVIACERKEGSEKLLRLTVDFGEEGTKNIFSGIYPFFQPEDLLNKTYIFVLNLEPRKMMGEESQGMLLAADGEKPNPLIPQEEAKPGTKIR